jgi:hypothetical protein
MVAEVFVLTIHLYREALPVDPRSSRYERLPAESARLVGSKTAFPVDGLKTRGVP